MTTTDQNANGTTSPLVPSDPNTSYITLVAAIIRAVLQILSGFGFAWALTVNGSQVQLVASAVVMLATVVWSLIQKMQAARNTHDVAVMSATVGKPVQTTSTPA